MVGRGPSRIGIAAVVRGDQQQIGCSLSALRSGPSSSIELLERSREAFHVFAVAVQHVEIDQVREDQARSAVAASAERSFSIPSALLFVVT